ncbi:iron hydrogenase [Symbiobacterium thermophilum IAM 14863]|uniref:Iron hydrogenase n=1 Tax=Symbiobacterium thermophilum (strain DSM 24528 / JCM 14929 / IAM 14863 / T) TaxID=292459 RepID=Q67JF9_SYMTH|nr:iron hydrogenase [Symbiobacterium thermophilum IAM 14863]
MYGKGVRCVIHLTIDRRPVSVEPGTTVLEAARQNGIHIPTLCYLKDINKIGACRMCLVEVEGARGLQTACTTPCTEGMVVHTNSPAVREARKLVLELLLSDHNIECPTCLRAGNCELMQLAQEMGVRTVPLKGAHHQVHRDVESGAIAVDSSKCVLCQRCVAVCREVQGVSAISVTGRGFESRVAPFFGVSLNDAACALCGQCTVVCPTGALTEYDETEAVWRALLDPTKHVVVQTAPAVRVQIGEPFGLPPGAVSTGKMVAGLRRLGFDQVFDTVFSADLTIMEEATELIQRLQKGGPLPLITSCSPGWVKFAEHFFPNMLENLSTCKSPQQMFGALAKTYYAEKAGIDPADMVVVSVMPCTAKKYEANRPEMRDSGYQDVDYVLTTRELARMFRQAGIDLPSLPDEEFDNPLGIGTGAGTIFGTTGGVMEAALRTAAAWLEPGSPSPKIEFQEVRGIPFQVREATVTLDGVTLNVAVANGLGAAGWLMEEVSAGRKNYHFIEIMGCPGGCIGGGGQPIPAKGPDALDEVRLARIASLYTIDERMTIRRSHENPAIQQVYAEYLGKPGSERAHHLLHTHYQARVPAGIRRRQPGR